MSELNQQFVPGNGQAALRDVQAVQLVPRFAQIGIGQWGKNVFRNLYELNLLSLVHDSSETTMAEIKKSHANVVVTPSYDHILNDPSIHAVVITTPAALHYEHVRKALLAGKDVFVEKPLALTVREGEELVRLAAEKQRVLMVGHILRYHPAVTKLKELIISGELGRIEYIYSNRLNIGRLRTEENILWSFAPHDISVIMMLLKEEPARIEAFGGDYLNRGIYDTTMTTLCFRNGVKAHIFVSWLHPYKEQKLIVVGSRKMAVFDDVSKDKLFLYPHTIEWKDGKIPVAQKADFCVVPIEPVEPLKEELKHFLHCVITRQQPLTDGNEGLRVLRVLAAAEKSLSGQSHGVTDPVEKTNSNGNGSGFFVHETACVDQDVRVGKGTRIWHFSHVLAGSAIGADCVIGQNASIGPDVTLGNHCKLQNNVSVYKGVTLEDDVFCGPSCVFTNVLNPRAFIERKHEFRQTLVRKGATIGANATVICGVTIGKYAMVAGGSVVKADAPDYALVAGVPAKQKGWVCKCGTTLKFRNSGHYHTGAAGFPLADTTKGDPGSEAPRTVTCDYCGNEYTLHGNTLTALRELDDYSGRPEIPSTRSKTIT
jgi:UDP-2-acetamido-3-amino-2,3-dideoxy-glucuronate N-acetyltransferase